MWGLLRACAACLTPRLNRLSSSVPPGTTSTLCYPPGQRKIQEPVINYIINNRIVIVWRYLVVTEVFLNLRFFLTWLRFFLPWLRFFRAFPSVVRQMPGQNSQDGTRTTLYHISLYLCCLDVIICVVRLLSVLFYVLFVCKCTLPPGDNPIAVNKYIIYVLLQYYIRPKY
jgi:hypothetical protein